MMRRQRGSARSRQRTRSMRRCPSSTDPSFPRCVPLSTSRSFAGSNRQTGTRRYKMHARLVSRTIWTAHVHLQVVFFHKPSRLLITTDLFWDYPGHGVPWGTKAWKFGMDRVYAPFYNRCGGTSLRGCMSRTGRLGSRVCCLPHCRGVTVQIDDQGQGGVQADHGPHLFVGIRCHPPLPRELRADWRQGPPAATARQCPQKHVMPAQGHMLHGRKASHAFASC